MPALTDWIQSSPPDERRLALIRLTLACAALFAVLFDRYRRTSLAGPSPKMQRRVAIVLAVIGAGAYFQFFRIGNPVLIHTSEVFHYYVGSKYFPELGYEKLYDCTAVAEVELGGEGEVRARRLRNLHENRLEDTSRALADPDSCTRAFTPARWRAFTADIRFFRSISTADYWRTIQSDHGYNPTPVWTLVGGRIASAVPARLGTLQLLAAVDPLLMAALCVLVAWAFGWRTACLLVVFWGSQGVTTLYWTGGGMLRQDWLLCVVASACMMRKHRFATAGALFAYAASVRIFPVLFALGPLAMVAAAMIRRAPVPRGILRMAASACVCGGLLFGASVVSSGWQAWPAFGEHIAMHDATPTANRMGWKNLVSYASDARIEELRVPSATDELWRWREARKETFSRRRWLYVAGVLAGLALLFHASSRLRTPWLAFCLGVLPITMMVGVTCYYYSFFLLAALLAKARPGVAISLLAAAVAREIPVLRLPFPDDRYAAEMAIFVVLAFAVALPFARRHVRLA